MKSRIHHIFFLPVLFLPGALLAQEIQKADNTTTLSSTGAWVGGVVPGPGNVARWDSLYTRSPSLASTLGASMTWAGIKVTNPQQIPRIRSSSGATLSLGSAGIDMSGATKDFELFCAATLGASQVWNVADGHLLTASSLADGAGFTLTKSGGGTLALTGATTLAANLAIGQGLVRVAPPSGTTVLSGAISGGGVLEKDAAGAVTLSGNNGGFNGTLRLLTGTLNLNSAAALGGAQLALSGGTLDNTSGGPLTLASGTQTWTGNFAFGGTNNLDLGTSQVTVSGTCAVALNAGTLTASEITGPGAADSLVIGGAGTLAVPAGRSISMGGKFGVSGGTLRISGGQVECGLSSGSLEIGGGGLAELTGGTMRVPAITRGAGAASLALDGGKLVAIADSNTFVAGLDNLWVDSGGAVIDADGWWITIPQALRHDPSLGGTPDGGLVVRDTAGGGELTLTGASTYTGPTVIEAGTLIIGTGGSIAASPVIEVRDDAVLDAAAGMTLASGQTLRGTGAVFGKLTVGPGATLSPGTDATPYAAMDMFDAVLKLQGTAEFGIRKTLPEIDRLTELDRVTYGGTLKVTAAPGTFFAKGDRFVLFDALRYSGGFASFELPALPGGLFWETYGLTTDGSIEVIDTLPRPVFSPAPGRSFGGGSLSITGVTGSTIHYTTDGSDPLVSPTRISAPSPVTGIAIPAEGGEFTIRACQTRSGAPNGAVVTAVYTIVDAGIWAEQGSGLWSDPAMWLDELIAQGAGISADFATVDLGTSATVTLDQPQTIGRLLFGNELSSGTWTLAGSTLTLDNKSAKPEIQVAAGRTATLTAPLAGTNGFVKSGGGSLVSQLAKPALSGPVLLSRGEVRTDKLGSLGNGTVTLGDETTGDAEVRLMQRGSDPWPPTDAFCTNDIVVAAGPTGRLVVGRQAAGNWASMFTGSITLHNNVIFRHEGADRLSIEGKVSGTGNVTFEGPRTNVDNPANDYTGSTTIAAGAGVQMRGGAFPATTDLTVNGRLGFDGAALTVASLSGTGTVNNWTTGDRTFTLGSATASRDAAFAGVINDTISLVKAGTGIQTLSGASGYTGTTTVTNGTLLINNTTGSGTGSGNVTVNSPATLGGSGTISGTVTVNGGATLAPGADAQSTGTLTTGGLTLAGVYQCQVSGATADRITVEGNLSLANSTLMVSATGSTEAGVRVIASYTGVRSGTFGGTLPAGYSVSYDDTAKQVLLTVPGGADPYGIWAASKGLTAANNGKTQDPDGDGVANWLEFYLGGEPLTADSSILPKVVAMDATTVTFGFSRLDAAETAFPLQRFQYGSTLTGWTPVTIGATGGPGPNGIIVTVTENGPAPDWITVVIPRSLAAGGKLFGRLFLSE